MSVQDLFWLFAARSRYFQERGAITVLQLFWQDPQVGVSTPSILCDGLRISRRFLSIAQHVLFYTHTTFCVVQIHYYEMFHASAMKLEFLWFRDFEMLLFVRLFGAINVQEWIGPVHYCCTSAQQFLLHGTEISPTADCQETAVYCADIGVQLWESEREKPHEKYIHSRNTTKTV